MDGMAAPWRLVNYEFTELMRYSVLTLDRNNVIFHHLSYNLRLLILS